VSVLDYMLKSDLTARRLEVTTETGRRRWLSEDDKARIVEERLVPGAVAFRDCPTTWVNTATGVHLAPASALVAGNKGR
jgi:hypothetical protein